MATTQRSGCPINLAIELFGDRWTLLILRTSSSRVGGTFASSARVGRENHQQRPGRPARQLVDAGILTRADDPTHKQKTIYSLTDSGIDLVPVLATVGNWGAEHCLRTRNGPAARELGYEPTRILGGADGVASSESCRVGPTQEGWPREHAARTCRSQNPISSKTELHRVPARTAIFLDATDS